MVQVSKASKSVPEFAPHIVRKSPRRFSAVLSDKPIARTKTAKDKRSTWHYAEDGTVVRVDAIERKITIPEPIEENVYMGLTSAAERVGAHPSTIRRAVERGTLRTRRIGTHLYTTPAWLEEYKRNRRPAGRPRKTA